jgi:L-histidine Nalpha-methyltransferase / hercynylcysteine S-oxide synthase
LWYVVPWQSALVHSLTKEDIQITKATRGNPTEPAAYAGIFERGIDPDVDHPELCHDHSATPDTWPPLAEIVQYQRQVRDRIASLVASGKGESDRAVGRALWLAFEHEVMHLETYLYMLLQSSKTLSPPGATKPEFEQLDAKAEMGSVPNEWFRVPTNEVKIGLEDPENDLGPDRYFGWDNEKSPRNVRVAAFEAQGRPISNGEYARYLWETGSTVIPASWVTTKVKTNSLNGSLKGATANGFMDTSRDHMALSVHDMLRNVSVRTVYGPIPLQYARHWPVMASYDELAAYARWSGGRIPTLEEARSIYSHVEATKQAAAQEVSSSLISAVNGYVTSRFCHNMTDRSRHLSNNGVEETPPRGRSLNGFPEESGKQPVNPRDIFIDLEGCNVGFRNWTPTAVTQNGNRLCGQSDFGGVWEWTSSVLSKWDGFEPQASYPGYTADFFDGKHNIILGGSWATHPRVAGRKTL